MYNVQWTQYNSLWQCTVYSVQCIQCNSVQCTVLSHSPRWQQTRGNQPSIILIILSSSTPSSHALLSFLSWSLPNHPLFLHSSSSTCSHPFLYFLFCYSIFLTVLSSCSIILLLLSLLSLLSPVLHSFHILPALKLSSCGLAVLLISSWSVYAILLFSWYLLLSLFTCFLFFFSSLSFPDLFLPSLAFLAHYPLPPTLCDLATGHPPEERVNRLHQTKMLF